MKEKEILKIIKEDIELSTPDVIDKIDLKSIRIIPKAKVITKRKSINIFQALSLATATLVIGLFAGLWLFKPSPAPLVPSILTVSSKDIKVAEYAISGVSLISNDNSVNTSNRLLMASNTKNINAANNKDINNFHNYIGIIEEYLKLTKSNITIIRNHEDKEYDFEFKMIVEKVTILNKTNQYIFYYNESSEIDDDEVETEMEGIMLLNNKTYIFKSEEEKEHDESELKVIIHEKDNYNNRVEIKKEIEEDEYYHRYIIYKDGNSSIKVKFEAEDNEQVLEIDDGNKKDEFYFKIINDKAKLYEITIDNDEEFIFGLKIDIVTKQYLYTYNDQIITK